MPDEDTRNEWEKFHDKNGDELAVIMLALVTFSAATLITLPFQMRYNYATDTGAYEVLFAAPINDSTDGGMTINESGRIMAFISGSFDRLFGKPTGTTNDDDSTKNR